MLENVLTFFCLAPNRAQEIAHKSKSLKNRSTELVSHDSAQESESFKRGGAQKSLLLN